MKIEQRAEINGITVTLGAEVPQEALKTWREGVQYFCEPCNTDPDILLEAFPRICQGMNDSLLRTYYQVSANLAKVLLDGQLGEWGQSACNTPSPPEEP